MGIDWPIALPGAIFSYVDESSFAGNKSFYDLEMENPMIHDGTSRMQRRLLCTVGTFVPC
jgi:hypothetical protein